MAQLDQRELINIFAEVLETDPGKLSDASSPANVEGWDSAKSMELVIMVEEAAKLEFTADELEEMVSIGATKAVLMRRGVFAE